MSHLPKLAILAAFAVGIAGCGQVEDYAGVAAPNADVGSDEGSAAGGQSDGDTDADDEGGSTTADADSGDESDGAMSDSDNADGGDAGSDDADSTDAPGESSDDTNAGNDSDDNSSEPADDPEPEPDTVPMLNVQVVNTYPHDSGAFTQGLTVIDGVLLESTGLYGSSSRRRVGLTNGEVSTSVPLDESLFGAGLTVVDGSTVIQLTWREGVAIVSDVLTLQEFDRFNYSGEGWGLCSDDDRLIMSDGSSTLIVRDPMSFAQAGTIDVTRDGQPVSKLNELECVGTDIWANVWLTNEIVRIDGTTGEVTGVADLTALVPPGPLGDEDVLNGIAYDPATNAFYVTGKNWDLLYEVSFSDS